MRPNKAETAGHGCHFPHDKAMHMPDSGLVFECVTCFNCLKGVKDWSKSIGGGGPEQRGGGSPVFEP